MDAFYSLKVGASAGTLTGIGIWIKAKCQRQDYWPFFAIFNVRYWSLMLGLPQLGWRNIDETF